MNDQLAKSARAYSHRAASRLQHLLAERSEHHANPSWLIVYLDIITLLLATFILLVNQPQQEFAVEDPQILEEKLQPHQVEAEQPRIPDLQHQQLAKSEIPSDEANTNIAEELRRQLEMIEGDDLVVEVEPGTVSLQLPEAILFETGRSELLEGADRLLQDLVPILQQNAFPISVEGHTDNVPIASPRFPSNWELSAARASVVIRKLVELGVPYSRLKAIGYADTQPIASNETVEGRRSNRRVNIVIHAEAE